MSIASELDKAQKLIGQSKYKDAQAIYDRVQPSLERISSYDLTVKYYGDQGILNFYQGDFTGAFSKFEMAYEQAVDNKHEIDQMRYLNNMGAAMTYKGDLKGSVSVQEKSITLAKKLNDTLQLSKSLNNLGLVYDEMGELDRALGLYEKAIKLKLTLGLKEEALTTRLNIAGIKLALGKKKDSSLIQSALYEYQQILKDAQELDKPKTTLQALNNSAIIYKIQGDTARAMSVYKDVFKKAELLKDDEVYRVAALNLGINYYQKHEDDIAAKYLFIAEPIIESNSMPTERAKLYKYLSYLYKAQGNDDKAYSYLESYTLAKDSLSNELLQDKIANFEIKYSTAEKEQEILKQRATLAEKALEIQKSNQVITLVSVGAVFIFLLGLLFYRQQKIKNAQLTKEKELEKAMAQIEIQNKLQEQRLRISRDLHDNIGSQLTFLISSIDNLNYGQKLGRQTTSEKLSELSNYTRTTIDELRDTIWAMNKNNISIDDIHDRTNTMVAKININSQDSFLVETQFEENMNITFNAIQGMHIFRIIQESLNNAIKYAQAHLILIKSAKEENNLIITIIDNGKGFDIEQQSLGNGLKNMQDRASMMESNLEITSTLQEGTHVALTIPI
ncbi:putative transmembrane protein [Nonlabens dokdonensis DSW-6]|uniref:histidine kinase n=1 Tax=Nonlabens dokdonensis (strain DSM 17205 / KCTC 12402 / DSW-6) TaxID=592029 RepID=L7W2N5_NONDD|nr:putative transmembrane protein [Nonlabens dokdonensis DSW-6]